MNRKPTGLFVIYIKKKKIENYLKIIKYNNKFFILDPSKFGQVNTFSKKSNKPEVNLNNSNSKNFFFLSSDSEEQSENSSDREFINDNSDEDSHSDLNVSKIVEKYVAKRERKR